MKHLKFYSLIMLVGVAVSCSSDENQSGNNAHAKAPDFTLQTLGGEDFPSDNLHGKVVVLDFWATWCQPCIKEIPNYNALYKKYKDQGFVMVGITLDSGPPASVKPFVERFNIQYPIYMGNYETKEAFGGIRGYPTTIVIDRDWKLVERYLGMSSGKVEKLVEKLVSD